MDPDKDFAAVEKSIRIHQNIYTTVDKYLSIMTKLNTHLMRLRIRRKQELII